MYRDSQNWLRYRVDQTVSRKDSSILKHIRKYKTYWWLDELISIKRWYLTVFATLMVFLLGTLFFHLFKVSDTKLDTVIDQRSSNLSTVGGMSLAVIAFLMTNIAVKESYAYEMVFRRTKFYVVVLCLLTALGCFVLIGTFRYVIKAGEWYNDLMLSSVFIFVGILVLIGYLFFSAIRFTNPVNIDELVYETLLLNVSTVIYEGLIQKYSLEAYHQLMGQRGIIPYNPQEHFDRRWLDYEMTTLTAEEVKRREAKERYIVDIDMIGLATYFDMHKGEKLYYHDLYIGQRTANEGTYIVVPGTENKPDDKKVLRNFLAVAKDRKPVESVTKVRQHYDLRLVDYAENGKDKELERLLKGLEGLFALQMTYQHQHEFDLIQGLQPVLADAVNAAIRKKNLPVFRHLMTFCSANCFKAIEQLDLYVFSTMLGYYAQVFNQLKLRSDEKDYRDLLPYGLDPAGYFELFLYHISEQKKTWPDKIKIVNQLGYHAYRAYGLILYYMLSLKDYKNLKKSVDALDKALGDEPDYKTRVAYQQALRKPEAERDIREISALRQRYAEGKALQTYKRQTLFGIKAWIVHLLRHQKLEKSEGARLLAGITIPYPESEDVLDDILFFRQGLMFQYFTWQSWVFPDYFDSEDFTISNPSEWLTVGFMAEQIIRYHLPVFDSGLQLIKAENLSFLIAYLKNAKQYFTDHLADWQGILRVADQTNLERKADAVIGFFEHLEGNQQQAELARVAAATIKTTALKEFKLQASVAWKKESGIYQLFERSGKIDTDKGLTGNFIGFDRYMADLKRFFVDYKKPDDIRLLNALGSQAARGVDDVFFGDMIAAKPPVNSGSLLEMVESGLAAVRGRGKKPDAIFVAATKLYLEQDFLDDWRYVEKAYEADSTELSFLKGWFEDVPVYSSYADGFDQVVLIAEFGAAFTGRFVTDAAWPETVLQVAVKALTRPEAVALATARSNGQPPAELLVLKFMNGVQLKLGIAAKFELADQHALFTGSLLPSKL